jgi:hypothetical protein
MARGPGRHGDGRSPVSDLRSRTACPGRLAVREGDESVVGDAADGAGGRRGRTTNLQARRRGRRMRAADAHEAPELGDDDGRCSATPIRKAGAVTGTCEASPENYQDQVPHTSCT